MANKRDVIDDFQQFIIDLVKDKTPQACELQEEEKYKLSLMKSSFRFLTKFESNEAFKSQVNVDNVFKDGYLYIESLHEGTEKFDKLVRSYPNIKKMNNYDNLIVKERKLAADAILSEEIVVKEDNILHQFLRFKPIKELKMQKPFGLLIKENFKHFSLMKGVIKVEKGFVVPERYYYAHKFNELSGNDKACDVFIEVLDDRLCCYRLDEDGYVTLTNFFTERLFKLYTEDGEIEDYDSVDYMQIFEQIRHSIAHSRLKSYCMLDGFDMVAGRIEIDKDTDHPTTYVILMVKEWFESLILLSPQIIKSTYKFINLPKLNKPITEKEVLNEWLNNARVVKVQLDEYGATSSAFKEFVCEYMRKYRNDDKIKKPVDEFIGGLIDKYYENFKVENLEFKNLDILKNRLIQDVDFLEMKPDKERSAAVNQMRTVECCANDFFADCLETDEVLNMSNYVYPNIFAPSIIEQLFKDFMECSNGKKAKNIKATTCLKVETIVAFCQFLIFYRLIYTNSYDFWTTIDSSQKMNLAYYETDEGKTLLKIKDQDMSMFTLKYKNTVGKVMSFDDKLTVLRLLRNAVGHGSVKFALDGSSSVMETRVFVSSLKNPDCSVSVKCKHLMEFLNQPFFRDQQVLDDYCVKLNRDEVETEMKKLVKG